MYIVVLDTNALYGDFHLESLQALSLRDNLRALGGELVIPEVVIDEAERKFNHQLQENIRELKKSAKKYRLLTGFNLYIPESSKKHDFRQRLWEVADHILPYPNVCHQDVVKRLLAGYRPFSTTGDKGYRDFLVWRSVLHIAKDSDSTVLFVTGNHKDFCAKKDNQLHEDLIKDLQEHNIQCDRVVITKSFSSANAEYLEKKLEFHRAKLSKEENQNLLDQVQRLISGYVLGEVIDCVPQGPWFSVELVEFHEFPELSILNVMSAGKEAKQVTVSFTGNALVDIFVAENQADFALECLNFSNLNAVLPDDDDGETALIYGDTKVSGTLIVRLPRESSIIRGMTLEKLTVKGINHQLLE